VPYGKPRPVLIVMRVGVLGGTDDGICDEFSRGAGVLSGWMWGVFEGLVAAAASIMRRRDGGMMSSIDLGIVM
jgi:hypothetical protein